MINYLIKQFYDIVYYDIFNDIKSIKIFLSADAKTQIKSLIMNDFTKHDTLMPLQQFPLKYTSTPKTKTDTSVYPT